MHIIFLPWGDGTRFRPIQNFLLNLTKAAVTSVFQESFKTLSNFRTTSFYPILYINLETETSELSQTLENLS
jgi:hypothetical protein